MKKRTLRSPKNLPREQSNELDFLDALSDTVLAKPFTDSRSFGEVIPGWETDFLKSPCTPQCNEAPLDIPPGFPPLHQEFLQDLRHSEHPVQIDLFSGKDKEGRAHRKKMQRLHLGDTASGSQSLPPSAFFPFLTASFTAEPPLFSDESVLPKP